MLMNKAFHYFALTVTTTVSVFLCLKANAQSIALQDDSMVTITPSGDTIISFIPRSIDFGQPIIPGEKSNKKLNYTAEEKEEFFETYRNRQQSEEARILEMLRKASDKRIEKSRDGLSYAVGEIPLTSGVSPSGARTYQIPIPTTPGVRFAPSLSLVYNSQGGEGNAGYGWNLVGIPSITLINENVYYHGQAKAADGHNSTDSVFALDGVPIVQNDDPATAQTFPFSTARGHILVSRQLNQQGFVKSFTVLYPNGDKGVFGSVIDDPESNLPLYPLIHLENLQQDSIVFHYHTNYYHFERDVFSIEYGHDGSGIPRASISLAYDYFANNKVHFYAGQEVTRSRCISRIDSKNNDDVIRRFDLTHETRDNVHLLTQIDCSSGGESLTPLIFTYGKDGHLPSAQDSLRVVDSVLLTTFFPQGNVDIINNRGKFVKGRFDDGTLMFPEFDNYTVVATKKKHYKYGSSYAANQTILFAASLRGIANVDNSLVTGAGFQTIAPADVDGDGADEIVRINFGESTSAGDSLKLAVYKSNPSGHPTFLSASSYILHGVITDGDFKSPYERQFLWGDFDGNGKVQLLAIAYETNYNGVPQTCYAALIDIHNGILRSEDVLFSFPYADQERVFAMDFDGDSRTELCRITSAGLQVYRLGNTGHFTLDQTLTATSSFNASDKLFYTDLNGDGYLDIVKAPASGGYFWTVFAFDGHGLSYRSVGPLLYNANNKNYFLDINRDGMADLISTDGQNTTTYINLTGFSFQTGRVSTGLFTDTKGISPANMLYGSGMSSFIKTEGYYVKLYDYSAPSPELRALVSSEDSFSRVTTNNYEFLPELSGYWAENASVDNSAGFVLRTLPVYVLACGSKYTSLQANSPYEYLFHSFHSPVCHNLGLGFCGFSHIRERDFTSGTIRIKDDYSDPQRLGVPTVVSQRLGSVSSTPWTTTSFTYDSHATIHGKLSPRLTRAVTTDSLTGIETDISYGPYDIHDFPKQVWTTFHLAPDTLETYQILNREYIHSTSPTKYVLGVIAEESLILEQDGDGWVSWKERDTTTFDSLFRPVSRKHLVGAYDYSDAVEDSVAFEELRAHRELLKEGGKLRQDIIDTIGFDILLDADSLIYEKRWTYDSHGNIASEKTAPYESSVFTGDSLIYDSRGRYILHRIDALGRMTSYAGYDKFGNPATATDHKGRSTSYSYDAWGRLIRTVLPDGTVERDTLAWDGAGLYTATRTATGLPESVTHYDALGREIRSGIKRFNGQWQYIDREYDARGRLYRVSLPYRGTAPSLWNVYAYDDYDRPVSITEASGKISTWAYSGTSTTTVRDSVTSTSTVNAMGDVVKVTDAGGTILYSLRDDGQPSSITAPGGVVTIFTYDGYGRQTAIVDPSAGTRTTQESWLADGSSVVVSTNPNGSVTTHTDRFGRTTLVERSGAHSTAYTYGSDGLLLSMISSNGADRVFTYDAYDRVATETDSVACFVGTRWIRKTFTYGAGSVVSSIKYTSPDGDITTEAYTYANGHNTGITLPDNTPVWSLVSENDLGAPTQILSGQVTREYGYTSTGQPTYRKMGNPVNGGLGSLQHFTYQFNPRTGNLMSRTDVNHNQAETFAYDALNRLASINGRTVTYDNPTGNITAIGGVGAMTYGDSTHPYQLTGMTPVADSLVSFGTQRITYTAFDRPATIKEGADSVTFQYGCSGERMTMEETISLGFGELWNQTAYIGGRYECKWVSGDLFPGKEILYLGGDAYSAPMVYIKQGNDSWTPYNIGRDYLGSITQISTTDGTPVAEYSYDPWGRLRDPQTLSIYARGHEPTLMLGRGFTGHAHLPQFGLINMNARLYDPLVGRFLSPDPFVQDADFSQSVNRYSYCVDNPLKHTDVNGEIFGTLFGVISDLVSNLFVRTFSKEKWDWTQTKLGWEIDKGLFHTDPNKRSGERIWEFVSKLTWQLPQALLGDLFVSGANAFGQVNDVTHDYGITAVDMGLDNRAVTIGYYTAGPIGYKADWRDHLFVHEYGHYIQSQRHGPLFLLTVGIPSLQSSIIQTDNPNAPRHNTRWFEADASYKGAAYFDNYYGSKQAGYVAQSPYFFDRKSFIYGGNNKSTYVNPRTGSLNSSRHPISGAFHWTDIPIYIPIIGLIPALFYL